MHGKVMAGKPATFAHEVSLKQLGVTKGNNFQRQFGFEPLGQETHRDFFSLLSQNCTQMDLYPDLIQNVRSMVHILMINSNGEQNLDI
ncbi:hypothetical protein BpHYR1_048377 [Brachionus plicatilis]|uniref:Uncharacterized protein n=1 Tax=Brachionus plicatilis TaxID=10195 RepID=A0A3M7QFM3_BRAPC|nr:hypothetical protein BpHYR1_048377 [Brachionus plicatilis]